MTTAAASTYPITLLLDGTERETSRAAVVAGSDVQRLEQAVRAQALPQLIEESLGRAGLTIESIQRLAVCNQPGSLTGTRIGVTVGNTLAWLNKVPIIECANDFETTIHQLQDAKKLRPVRQASVAREAVYSPQ